MDYEPKDPAAFSLVEEDNYSDGDDYPAHRDGPEDKNENTDKFPAYSVEDVDRVGGKRSQNFPSRGGGRRRWKPPTRR